MSGDAFCKAETASRCVEIFSPKCKIDEKLPSFAKRQKVVFLLWRFRRDIVLNAIRGFLLDGIAAEGGYHAVHCGHAQCFALDIERDRVKHNL